VEMLVVGLVANVTLDVWQQVFRLLFKFPITNWAMVARWIAHIPQGHLAWPDIGKAPPVPNELFWGWVVHYAVGPSLGALYVALMRFVFHQPLSFAAAFAFGIVTVAITWFVIEPLLGAGPAARNVPNGNLVRAQDLTSHAAFGVGLYLGGVLAATLAP